MQKQPHISLIRSGYSEYAQQQSDSRYVNSFFLQRFIHGVFQI